MRTIRAISIGTIVGWWNFPKMKYYQIVTRNTNSLIVAVDGSILSSKLTQRVDRTESSNLPVLILYNFIQRSDMIGQKVDSLRYHYH